MNVGQAVFARLIDFVPDYHFYKSVARYRGEYNVQAFPFFNQYFCLMFAQMIKW
jgi:hypothetical protein